MFFEGRTALPAIDPPAKAPRPKCRAFLRRSGFGLRLESDRIQVQVIFADPRQEMIRFQEVLATAAEEPAKESVEESSEEELVEEPAE